MERILSKKNDRVKKWKKLHTKKGRDLSGLYLIEGFHLIAEAMEHDISIQEFLISERLNDETIEQYPQEKVVIISKEIADYLSDTESPQGVFAVIEKEIPVKPTSFTKPYLLLDNVQDPGNVGTMIRTADAAGYGGVVLGKGTVDLYNSKVLRSTQGGHFHFPVYEDDLFKWFTDFKSNGFPIYGTELNEDAASYREIKAPEVYGLVMGNEGKGMDKELLKQTTKNLYIPITGQAESLNVAVAAGILMFSL
ncbi:RNA methyltransferase [Desemzia sp. RIT804]|uniref:TrmH family RNA methyltransferase n=1 Tax=Desemzia sp. RIT 804 TaxID=2810209 RepID=UPI00194F1FD9|nr:RNA methyltransferase [Desemzia sp. RIT 804]MBM6613309.1 RNA methyltransferase [Desemzia sp. RIT 804]